MSARILPVTSRLLRHLSDLLFKKHFSCIVETLKLVDGAPWLSVKLYTYHTETSKLCSSRNSVNDIHISKGQDCVGAGKKGRHKRCL